MADVTLKLTVGSVSIEVSGPQDYADAKFLELVTQYLSLTRPASTDSRSVPVLLEAGGKKLAVNEFLRKVSPQNQPDRGIALAYYLEKVENVPSFTSTELAEKAREARSPFGNVSDVVGKLATRGLLMSAGEREGNRAYALTASGLEYVESMLTPSA